MTLISIDAIFFPDISEEVSASFGSSSICFFVDLLTTSETFIFNTHGSTHVQVQQIPTTLLFSSTIHSPFSSRLGFGKMLHNLCQGYIHSTTLPILPVSHIQKYICVYGTRVFS